MEMHAVIFQGATVTMRVALENLIFISSVLLKINKVTKNTRPQMCIKKKSSFMLQYCS